MELIQITMEQLQQVAEMAAERGAERALRGVGKKGAETRYTIQQIVNLFPSIKGRTLQQLCKQGKLGKMSRGDGKYHLTATEVNNYFF